MNRDIVVKCCLSAEEFIGLQAIADDAGLSQSALLRSLLKREISAHAMRLQQRLSADSPKDGQD